MHSECYKDHYSNANELLDTRPATVLELKGEASAYIHYVLHNIDPKCIYLNSDKQHYPDN